jgi:hypothetical protein
MHNHPTAAFTHNIPSLLKMYIPIPSNLTPQSVSKNIHYDHHLHHYHHYHHYHHHYHHRPSHHIYPINDQNSRQFLLKRQLRHRQQTQYKLKYRQHIRSLLLNQQRLQDHSQMEKLLVAVCVEPPAPPPHLEVGVSAELPAKITGSRKSTRVSKQVDRLKL